MVLLWGPALIQIYNDSYRELMGDKHPAGLGQPTRECWPEVWRINEPLYARVWQGEALTFEDQLYPITRHGYLEQAFFTLCYSPVGDETGRSAGVLVTVFETTQRLEAERALRTSEERFRQVFLHAPVGMCVLRGPELIYELINSSYQEFLPDRALLGRPLLEAIPELDPTLIRALKEVLKTGNPFSAHELLVPLDRNRDGVVEDFWFTFIYEPLRDSVGAISGVVAVAVDVTLQVRARRELERANKALEEFSHAAAHDLQEPLRTVNAYAQLLIRSFGPQATGEQHEFAGFVQRGAMRMQQLIRDLLSYSQVVDTTGELVSGEVDLEVALSQALSLVESRVTESRAVITHLLLPVVRGDTVQVAHVFQNLLSNAIKYRKPDSIPKIHVTAKQDGADWVISVQDNGIGFEQKHAVGIFGLFKRLHREDEYQGTGLGLAICQRIIERYGGRMWAESESGVGSNFFFSLPVAP
ncbi:MAG: ATP-binding protein [Acidobacteriota bacterium]|nr:ATP-binding protein [Acidobacteriota bacterium]